MDWAADENYRWDLPDGSARFYIPDIVFIHPDAASAEEERAAIVLAVEVTLPSSPDTVLNDRSTKPKEYARAGVPCTCWWTRNWAGGPCSASPTAGSSTR